MPLGLAYAAGAIAECVWKVFAKSGEPPITRFVAVELAKDHYFDIEVANRDLGYKAAVDMETGLKATIEDLKARGF
jgi:nucleoside-diphosphate-sugar epimerase